MVELRFDLFTSVLDLGFRSTVEQGYFGAYVEANQHREDPGVARHVVASACLWDPSPEARDASFENHEILNGTVDVVFADPLLDLRVRGTGGRDWAS
jgi:hypothetical protein